MAQDLVLREEACDDLVGYATTPISFLVDRVLRVDVPASEAALVQLDEVRCIPYWKDYDEEDGNAPTDWSSRFDTSNWRVFSAWSGEQRLGGIVVVHDSPAIDMLEGRDDLAVLWLVNNGTSTVVDTARLDLAQILKAITTDLVKFKGADIASILADTSLLVLDDVPGLIAALNDISVANILAAVIDGSIDLETALKRIHSVIVEKANASGADPKVIVYRNNANLADVVTHSIPAAGTGRTVT